MATQKAKRYFIYYNNGYFETVDKVSMTFLHMIDIGVIKIIFDYEESKLWKSDSEGIAKSIIVPDVSGL